jgi:hypothetical protein
MCDSIGCARQLLVVQQKVAQQNMRKSLYHLVMCHVSSALQPQLLAQNTHLCALSTASPVALHLPLLLLLFCLRRLQIVNERFWLPGWQILELLNGTGATLRRNVATIKAFALDIVERRRKQLAAAAAAGVAGSNRRDQGPAAVHSSITGSPEDANDVAADNSTPAAVTAVGAGAVGGAVSGVGAGGVTEKGVDDGEAAKDLLSLFMEVPGPDGKPLNTQQLIDTVINFIIAGRDTTAQVGGAWCMHSAAESPRRAVCWPGGTSESISSMRSLSSVS